MTTPRAVVPVKHTAAAVMASSTSFYEVQLTVLAVFCVCAVIFERKFSKKEEAAGSNSHARSPSVVASSAEAGVPAGKHGSTAAALERQYLIVYGIVMCEYSILQARIRTPCFEYNLTAAQAPIGYKDHTCTHSTMNNTPSPKE